MTRMGDIPVHRQTPDDPTRRDGGPSWTGRSRLVRRASPTVNRDRSRWIAAASALANRCELGVIGVSQPGRDTSPALARDRVRPAALSRRLRVVDLFAGAGGLSEGFRQAGYQVIGGTDLDPDACATYARNFPKATTLCGDMRLPELREQVVALSQGIDVLVGYRHV